MRDISKNIQAVESFNSIVDSAFHKGADCRDVLIDFCGFNDAMISLLKRVDNALIKDDDNYFDKKDNFDEYGMAKKIPIKSLLNMYDLWNADEYTLNRGNVLISEYGKIYFVTDTVRVDCPIASQVDAHPLSTTETVDFANCVEFDNCGGMKFVEMNSRENLHRSLFYKKDRYQYQNKRRYWFVREIDKFMTDLRDGTMLEKLLSHQNSIILNHRIDEKVKEQIENVRHEQEMLSPARITVLEWKTLFDRVERLEEDIKRCEMRPNYDEY